jgi:drug/metabolite transporter (DMT)-like permease
MQDKRAWAELALACVCLIWGSTFVLVKNALDDISPALFLAIRFSLGGLVLGILYLRNRTPRPRQWTGGIVTGVFLYAGYFLQTLGLRYTTPAKSGFLTGLYVVLVPLLAAAVYQKPPRIPEWIGVLLATTGIGLMTLTTARLEIGTGDLLTIGCAFAFAAHLLLLSHYSKKIEIEWLALLQISTCAVLAMITFPISEAPFVRWTPGVLWALGITSILATAFAFLIQTWGQKYTTATRAALIFSLEPLFAWLTSYVFEREILTRQAVAGAGCIVAGILLVELKPSRRQEYSKRKLPSSS